MRSIKTLLLVIALLLVVDGIGVYYLIAKNAVKLSYNNQQQINQNINQIPTENLNTNLNENFEGSIVADNNQNLNTNLNESVTAPIAVNNNQNLNTNQAVTTGLTKCTTMNCLITLAQSCQKGELVYSFSGSSPFAPGMNFNSKTDFVIGGKNADGSCAFSQQLLSIEVTASPSGRSELIKSGMTNAEIDAQLKTMNDSYKEVANQIMECEGVNKNVATYFKNYASGTGSTSCNLGVGEASCTLEPDISCITTIKQNHVNSSCSLSSLTAKLDLFPGVSISVTATGFKDGSKLSWVSSDSKIASVSAKSGGSNMVAGLKAGSAQLKITDNAVGADCFITIPITVEQNNY